MQSIAIDAIEAKSRVQYLQTKLAATEALVGQTSEVVGLAMALASHDIAGLPEPILTVAKEFKKSASALQVSILQGFSKPDQEA